MKPNNYYYRKIAEILNNTEYEKFYSSYYYMKAIAESYGYSYTGIKPTNKYLRDWHTDITSDTPETFKNNLYYLYHIALALYPSTPASKNENYYLRIIYENIDTDRVATALDITPPTITVTDEFSVTGVLTEAESPYTAIEDANVKLQWTTDSTWATYQESEAIQTDEDGEVIFESQTVTTIDRYYFRLVYSGNSTYASATSSVIYVDPSKESTGITLTTPVNNSSYLSDGAVIFAGTLKELGETGTIKNAQINIIQSSTTVATGQTGNDGSFSITVDADDLSTGSVRVKYDGSTIYSETYEDRTITITAPSITSDKSVLSYVDTDYCTLSTTLSNSGQTVTLYQMLGSTPDPSTDTNLGTMTDNGDGTYSKRYDSQGIGDVTFYGKCGNLLIQTYEVQDMKFYDDASTDKSSDYTIRTSKTSTLTHNTGYYTMTGDSSGSGVTMMIGRSPTSLSTSDDWIFEADIHSGSSSQWKSISLILDSTHIIACIVYSNKTFLVHDYGGSEIGRTTFSTYDSSAYYRVKIKLENNALTIGLYDTSDNLLGTVTGSLPSAYQNQVVYPSITQFANESQNYSVNFKNVKVKPL